MYAYLLFLFGRLSCKRYRSLQPIQNAQLVTKDHASTIPRILQADKKEMVKNQYQV